MRIKRGGMCLYLFFDHETVVSELAQLIQSFSLQLLGFEYMFETPIHVIDFEGSLQSGVVEYGYVTLGMVKLSIRRRGSALPLVRSLTLTEASMVSLKAAL